MLINAAGIIAQRTHFLYYLAIGRLHIGICTLRISRGTACSALPRGYEIRINMSLINTIEEGEIIVIKLEPFESTDFQQLMTWIESPRFMIQWGGKTFTFPLTEQQLENYINSDSLIFRVVLEEKNRVIGHINLTMDRNNNSGRIGKVLIGDSNCKGQGLGQRMVQEVINIAFGQLKLHRVSLGVFDFNLSAIACYEKVGFVKEGLLREARKVEGEYWNLWEMSILEKEWLDKLNA